MIFKPAVLSPFPMVNGVIQDVVKSFFLSDFQVFMSVGEILSFQGL